MNIPRLASSPKFYRIAESIVPILTWLIITFPLWLSPFHPAVAAYLILAYFIYFLYKAFKTIYFAGISYQLIEKASKIDWFDKLKSDSRYQSIQHYIIITNYKESVEKVRATLERIAGQTLPREQITVVLAMEKREGDSAEERARILEKEFSGRIGTVMTVYHTLVVGEVVGKSSNEAYAAKKITEKVTREGIDPKSVIVTVADADSLLPKHYLAYVTLKYLDDKEGEFRFYWAPVLLYNNFWKLSLPIRIQAILSSVIRLSFLSWGEDLIQISTYSTNLWLLQKIGYWDPDVIPEDWHVFFQAFFTLGERVKTIPVYLPITRDAVMAEGLIKTFKTRYEQERRWAWGASDIPYTIVRFFDTPHIRPIAKLKKIMLVAETHMLWPTSFFILTVSASIPPLVNPAFQRTVLGFILPKLASFILTSTSILLLVILYFDHKTRATVDVKTRLRNIPLLFVQWYLLPITSFIFSSLPALEAHTRMLLGKKLEYKVTEKM